VADACVVRQPKAYPVYDEDYRGNIATIRLDLEGSYRRCIWSTGMACTEDHAIMTAMLMAENILAGQKLYDIWNVNEDTEYHEAGPSGVQARSTACSAFQNRSPIPERHSADLFNGSRLW